MIAVILSEISGWLRNESRATFSFMVIFLGVAGSFSFLRPEFCLELLTAVILWIAIKAGKENWSEFWTQDWVKRTNLSLQTVILGKVAAALAVCLIHLLFVFPVLIIMLILWGFTWMLLANVALTMMITALIATGFELCGSCLGKDEESFITSVPVGVWIIGTTLSPLLRPLNPFYLVWNIMVSNPRFLIAIHLTNLGLAVLSISIAVYLSRREAR